MNIIEIINELQLSVGDSKRMACPVCHAKNTFTITTGHQLNLFTGPLYFLYKIVSTINLSKELKTKLF